MPWIRTEIYRKLVPEELEKVKAVIGADRFTAGKSQLAREIFANLITDSKLQEFLTLVAYNYLH